MLSSILLSITAPAVNAVLGNTAALRGTVTDSTAPVTLLDYTIDGGTPNWINLDAATGAFSKPLDLSSLANSHHRLVVTAQDARGNTATVAETVMVAGATNPPALPGTGAIAPELASFDTMMTKFLSDYALPGGALAVAKDGQILYDRGFGYADTASQDLVQPGALFRIASLTKPITAVAVLQLVEQGKLRLDDKVFDVLGLQAPAGSFDVRWKQITILNLLQHTGGWDRDVSGDPMFEQTQIVQALGIPAPAGQQDIIRYMLTRSLDTNPGSHYAYSNFGYLLLGRVIEKLGGQSYADYVQQHVLHPLGITDMQLGASLLTGRAPGEVRYYVSGAEAAPTPAVVGPGIGQPVPWPYGGFDLESMDSHGGWLASAADLVRFGAAFNEPNHCKVLSAESIRIMFARPQGVSNEDPSNPVYYACGWQVRVLPDGTINTWHNGSLPGTSTLLVRRNDGLTWAVLFNSRDTPQGQEPSDAIDYLVHQAANAVTRWPTSQAPAITSTAAATFTVAKAGSVLVTTLPGVPASTTLTETGALPRGITFTAAGNGAATLHGTPAAGTGGVYRLTITARNGVSDPATQVFTLTVRQAPAITSRAAVTFTAGRSGSFTIKTTGYPAATLSVAGRLPARVRFVDNHNGTATLSGTPTTTGVYTLTIKASNSIASAAPQKFKLTIGRPTKRGGSTLAVARSRRFAIVVL